MLERQSLIARLAAGGEPAPQSIAANVDTLFVVTSCNADFNPSRLERYLAIAYEARVHPVIVLSKVDTCADPHETACAVRSALQDGRLDPRRLESYLKLSREAARAATPPWKLRQAQSQFGRIARAAQKRRRKDTGRE
jgi:putative ribosome biogenesis GTPase RsgA